KEHSNPARLAAVVSMTDRQTATKVRFMQDDDGLGAYLREIGKNRVLSHAEERELLLRMRRGDKRAFKDLITANLRFVVSVCRKYQHQGLPLTDLISEGNLGLIRAAQSFDETRTCRFISYAVWWVRQRILQALAEQSRNISLPVGKAALLRKMSHVRKTLEQKRFREPLPFELAEALCIKEKEALALMQAGRAPLSLSEPGGGTDDLPIEDMIADESADSPDERIDRARRKRTVLAVLDGLKELESQVLRLYFGLDHEHSLTLEEISFRLDVSPERIRQIKENALSRLRHPSRIQKLREAA
ncbi:MAG TPA: RNA polymerase sigma factor RpoD/SigA, partial [Fibrobacteria bacterium]|nr:RNA polymerase sigma factor RpoD/SigA [Fibrobacteria bacterium]